MEYHGLAGGFRDSMLACSDRVDAHCFCCVVFPFHDGITSCLHVHGNVPKCHPRMLWLLFISLLCMKNPIHIRLKGINSATLQERRLKTQTGRTGRCFQTTGWCLDGGCLSFLFYYLIIRFSDELNPE